MITETILEGTLLADGSLVLDAKPQLPPGRVQIILHTLQRIPDLPEGDPFWDLMKSIWAGQQARGYIPRSVEDVERERRENREGWAKRQEEIERLQEESRRLKEQPS